MARMLLFLALLFAPLSASGAQPPTSESRAIHLLAFGDSLTAGYGLDAGLGFAPQLEDALRREGIAASVTDAGVSGDTSAAGRERLEWTLDSLESRPDVAILELGGNDMLRALDPAVTEANLAAMIEAFAARDIAVVLAAVPAARNYDPAYVAAFEAIYPRLGERYGVPVIPFVPADADRAGLLLPDGVHPNFEGVKAIVSAMVPRLLGLPALAALAD
ncbi:arylesterase [Sphingomicrobium astaxanthinifaciens]|uniref:arylesterase n=1 Tax=Sphingomicrobium astaxanthinifaciens TaxID=1227949 RepID=UPI001FCC0D35|nr:arylesterase [Sphingomicrobium astaxanthinifaciens]MCJ7421002.1 arylesterase [Sphingomicrobium astaxanthinifaciens]